MLSFMLDFIVKWIHVLYFLCRFGIWRRTAFLCWYNMLRIKNNREIDNYVAKRRKGKIKFCIGVE